ncbi:predicted protein [Postia placenta Mad-698-R]|nr:predicted protein [Postia placenta Mad-698-R]
MAVWKREEGRGSERTRTYSSVVESESWAGLSDLTGSKRLESPREAAIGRRARIGRGDETSNLILSDAREADRLLSPARGPKSNHKMLRAGHYGTMRVERNRHETKKGKMRKANAAENMKA